MGEDEVAIFDGLMAVNAALEHRLIGAENRLRLGGQRFF
jgi:hypothetical protein